MLGLEKDMGKTKPMRMRQWLGIGTAKMEGSLLKGKGGTKQMKSAAFTI